MQLHWLWLHCQPVCLQLSRPTTLGPYVYYYHPTTYTTTYAFYAWLHIRMESFIQSVETLGHLHINM